MQTLIVGNKILYKYLCQWVKTVKSDTKVFARRYYAGKATILAESIEDVIAKAIELKGYKPNEIRRI